MTSQQYSSLNFSLPLSIADLAAPPPPLPHSLKMVSGSSQYRFGVLAKIVKHMRKRHQEGNLYPLTLEEILDETNQLDAGSKVKQVSADRL